jgi:hypothetical protein
MEERLIDGPRLEEAYRPGREEELGKRALGFLGEIAVQKRKQARAKHKADMRKDGAGGGQEDQHTKRRRGRLPPS